MAGPIPTWHFGRHSRGLSPLAAQRHAQIHRDQAARRSRQGPVDRGAGACPAVYSEILPTRVRYTALSIGYNIAVAMFGGFAPFIATWLIGVTGSNLAPSYYLIAAATITFLVVLRIRETAFEPLR